MLKIGIKNLQSSVNMLLLYKFYWKKGGIMRKLVILSLTLLFMACSNNEYVKLVDKGFVSSDIKDIKEKIVDKKTYYKYDYNKKFWKENVFLFVESGEIPKIYLGINYTGKEWLYMKSIEFVGNENLLIDFLDFRTFNPIWKDGTTITMRVEEKILFPLDEKNIENLEKIIGDKNVKIILRSDYDSRFSMRTLSEDESMRMKKILDLYKSIKEEKERKTDGN